MKTRIILTRLCLCILGITAPITNATPQSALYTIPGLYAGVQIGYENAPYKTTILSPGFTAKSLSKPPVAERLIIGWDINQQLGAEFGIIFYSPLVFKGIAKSAETAKDILPLLPHRITAYHNLVYLTAKYIISLPKKFSLAPRAGIGYLSRKGINFGSTSILKTGDFLVPVYGLGASYNVTKRWTLQTTWLGAPGRSRDQLPSTNFIGGGFIFRFNIPKSISKEPSASMEQHPLN